MSVAPALIARGICVSAVLIRESYLQGMPAFKRCPQKMQFFRFEAVS